MPDQKGRLTGTERVWAHEYAKTGDPTYAGYKAGYKAPQQSGSHNLRNPELEPVWRGEARKLLRDEGAFIGVKTLMDIAIDPKQPAGARVQAGDKLIRHSGIGADEHGEIPLHEASAAQLAQMADKARRRLEAMERALSDQAKPVIDQAPAVPESSVFE